MGRNENVTKLSKTSAVFEDPFAMDPIKEKVSASSIDSYKGSRSSRTGSLEVSDMSDNVVVSWMQYVSLLILFIINLLNYMDRFTVSGVLTQVQSFYNIDDASAGLLQTSFIIVFMLFAPPCGFLGDRYNRKYIMLVGIILWSLAVVAASFVPANYYWLFVTLRSAVGIGEASYSVIAPTIIADMFPKSVRGRMLMFFYFAIPVGSGLGYIVGSSVANLAKSWQWGTRVTPLLGCICIILIIFVLKEPKRGATEKINADDSSKEVERTSFIEDIKALCKIPTYLCTTIGYTAIVFVTGVMAFWTPAAVNRSYAYHRNLTSTNQLHGDFVASIAFLFGICNIAGGICGVAIGSFTAQIWTSGKYCMKPIKTNKAKTYVCAIGSVLAVPCMFLAIHLIAPNMTPSWIMMFLTVTTLSLNWAINVDILLDVVIPSRRSTANSLQILVSHLLGDASGPYFIGLISDALRGSKTGPKAEFDSVVAAFYIPNVLLVISAIFFFLASFFYQKDREHFLEQMENANEPPISLKTSPTKTATAPTATATATTNTQISEKTGVENAAFS